VTVIIMRILFEYAEKEINLIAIIVFILAHIYKKSLRAYTL